MTTHGWTRRQLLTRGGVAAAGVGGLAAAGAVGYAWPRTAAAADAPASDSAAGSAGASAPAVTATPDYTRGDLNFVSRSDLNPPAVTMTHYRRRPAPRAEDPPYIFLAAAGYPLKGPGEPGVMILDRNGGIGADAGRLAGTRRLRDGDHGEHRGSPLRRDRA